MLKNRRRLTDEAWAKQGHSLYKRRILPKLAGEKKGCMVAIDIDSADFAVADDALTASRLLQARRPRARIWLEQLGYRAAVRMGIWRDEERAG